MPRSMARRVALALVYEQISGGDADNDSIEMILEQYSDQDEADGTLRLQKSDRVYIDDLVQGTLNARSENEETISAMLSDGWSLERISRIDLCILLMALFEIAGNNVPDNVVVSEALKLTEMFSEPKSKSFINAILGKVVRGKQATGAEEA